MATDYASEMLGSSPASVDYASELLASPEPAKIKPSKGASFATLSKAAMVDDPQTKLKIFAQDRFPDDPSAVKRYGIVDGEVVYTGEDGNLYQETPDGFFGWAKETGANLIGKAPTIGGAVVGAIKGAPLGFPGMAGGAILGAMGGEGLRQTVGNVAFDEPQSSLGNFKGMAKEGAFAAAGELVGGGVASTLERNLARDIKRLDPAAVRDLESKAGRVGVDLFPAQVTGLRSLKGKHEVLGRLDASADIVSDAGVKQAEQANAAAYRYFGSLGKTGDISVSTAQAKQAAEDIVKGMKDERAELASPFYKKAFNKKVETSPELAELANTPIMRQALATAKRLAANERIKLSDPKSTMLGLHWTKMALDNMIDGAPTSGVGAVERRQMVELKNKLLSFMDEKSPDYELARGIYAGGSEPLDRAQTGLVGDLLDKERDLPQLGRRFFAPNRDPAEIRQARKIFKDGGKEEEWNSLVRSYMQDAFEQAGKFDDGMTGQAPRFRKQMIGNPRQREILKNALSPEHYEGLLDMSDVFEAIGRVKPFGGSPTMPLQESAKALRQESSGLMGKALAPIESLKDWIVEARLGNHAEKMAEILTTPGDLRRLKELRNLSPTDKKFIAGASALFGISASPARADEVSNPQLDQKLRQ